jgi:LysR family transcriptional regulator, positive regulator for ilvC
VDIHKLRALVVLSETLNFSRASELLHMSPSTLSRAIAQLEADLAVKLFERDNRSVVLTLAGKACVEFAQETLAQLAALTGRLQDAGTQLQGSIRLYCSVTASYSFLYELLSRFRSLHPNIRFILHTGDHAQALERILQGHEDVAIAARPDVLLQGIAFKPIAQSPLLLIVGKDSPYAALPLAWEKLPLILPETGVARQRLDRWFAKAGIKPVVQAQVAGHEAIVSMVGLGFGVGLVPKIVLDNSPLVDRVEPFGFQPPLRPYEVGLCVLEKRLKNPLVQAFWEQV